MAGPRLKLWAVIEVCLVFVLYRVILVPWVLPLVTRERSPILPELRGDDFAAGAGDPAQAAAPG